MPSKYFEYYGDASDDEVPPSPGWGLPSLPSLPSLPPLPSTGAPGVALAVVVVVATTVAAMMWRRRRPPAGGALAALDAHARTLARGRVAGRRSRRAAVASTATDRAGARTAAFVFRARVLGALGAAWTAVLALWMLDAWRVQLAALLGSAPARAWASLGYLPLSELLIGTVALYAVLYIAPYLLLLVLWLVLLSLHGALHTAVLRLSALMICDVLLLYVGIFVVPLVGRRLDTAFIQLLVLNAIVILLIMRSLAESKLPDLPFLTETV